MSYSVVPPTLAQRVGRQEGMSLVRRDGLVAFPSYWQVPAATEKAAYEAMLASRPSPTFDYYGFPWATIIDGLRGDAPAAAKVLMALKHAVVTPAGTRKRVTVAQHIHAHQFMELFKACGITDLFWSHATHNHREIGGIRVHPFPLFPAQTPDASPEGDIARPRRYLANFIGAYNPKIYLTNVREVIFRDMDKADDLLIIKRAEWHFDRAVYEEQIKGLRANDQRMLIEQRHTEEYLNAIKDSWFTLCPSGSGPSSIRIFESLCLGSIPIVLTRNLRLAGPQTLWEKAAIIEDDSAAGYERAVSTARGKSSQDRIEMLRCGAKLASIVGPRNYAKFIIGMFH